MKFDLSVAFDMFLPNSKSKSFCSNSISSEVWSEVIDQHPVLCHLTFKSAKCRVIAQGKVFAGQRYPSAGAQLLVHSCWCWKYDWMTVISYIEIYWNVSLNIFRKPEASQNSKYVVLLEFWPNLETGRFFLKTCLIGEIGQKFKSWLVESQLWLGMAWGDPLIGRPHGFMVDHHFNPCVMMVFIMKCSTSLHQSKKL